MLRYQKEDHLAFQELYSRHKDKVYSYIAKRLVKKDEIEDLYQKAFMKFHKSRALYDPKYEVLPWLYTITKSEFLDFIKKKQLESVEFNESLHSSELASVKIASSDRAFDIQAEKGLSRKEKDAIELRYFNEKEFEEISALLETSQAGARKLISRGLKKLREKYKRKQSAMELDHE